MRKTLFFTAIAAMVILSSCGMGCGSQPVVEEQVEVVEVDTIPVTHQPDTSVVEADAVIVERVQ